MRPGRHGAPAAAAALVTAAVVAGPLRAQPPVPDAGALVPCRNTVLWSTASEQNNFGFHVYRGDRREGPFERLTAEPIVGAGTSAEVHRYRFVDATIEPGRVYFYYVESLSFGGLRQRFTPLGASRPKSGCRTGPDAAAAQANGPARAARP